MSTFLILDQVRGQKNFVRTVAAKLGEEVLLEDRETPGVGQDRRATGMQILACICKASQALTSPGGKGITFTAAGHGWIVDDFSSASGAKCDGIVDPDLVGNVAEGDTFLVFRRGPMNFISSASISAGAAVKPADGGKFAPATSETPPQRCGRAVVAATAGDQTRRGWFDFTQP